jgi:hypothetical protein
MEEIFGWSGTRDTLLGDTTNAAFEKELSKYTYRNYESYHPICSQLCKKCYPKRSEGSYEKISNLVGAILAKHYRTKCAITNDWIKYYAYLHPQKGSLAESAYLDLPDPDKRLCTRRALYDSKEAHDIIMKQFGSYTEDLDALTQRIRAMHPETLRGYFFKS